MHVEGAQPRHRQGRRVQKPAHARDHDEVGPFALEQTDQGGRIAMGYLAEHGPGPFGRHREP